MREFTFERFSGDLKTRFEGAWTRWLFVYFALQEFVLVLLILMFLQKIVTLFGPWASRSPTWPSRGTSRWRIFRSSRATRRGPSFTTLEALCKALDCQPGDLLEYQTDEE